MHIRDYLDKYGLSQEAFAKMLGLSQGAVHFWVSGRFRVSAENARLIERVTGGEITAADLRPDIFGEAA